MIGIIAVIPAIGLLAWFVRFAVRRKVRKDPIDYENTLKPLKMGRIFLENEIKLLDKIQRGHRNTRDKYHFQHISRSGNLSLSFIYHPVSRGSAGPRVVPKLA